MLLKDKWELKSKLLGHILVYGLPQSSEELEQLNNNVFGKDCIFENVKE